MTKICIKCGNEIPLTKEYFQPRKTSKDGFRGECRKCTVEYQKLYHEKNKEHIAEKVKTYQQSNASAIAEYQKQYRKDNKETIRDSKRNHYQINREHYFLYQKQWREDNKEILSKRKSEYNKTHREQGRIRGKIYNARKKQLPATLTHQQWEKTKQYFNNCCAYCGAEVPLVQEHFIPVKKNGGYTYNNIVPACKHCNSSKQDRDFFEWYPRHKGFNKQREQKIFKFLGIP